MSSAEASVASAGAPSNGMGLPAAALVGLAERGLLASDLEAAQMVDAKYQVTGVGVTLTGRNGSKVLRSIILRPAGRASPDRSQTSLPSTGCCR